MKGIKRWVAALLCVLMLVDTCAVQASQAKGGLDGSQTMQEEGISEAGEETEPEKETETDEQEAPEQETDGQEAPEQEADGQEASGQDTDQQKETEDFIGLPEETTSDGQTDASGEEASVGTADAETGDPTETKESEDPTTNSTESEKETPQADIEPEDNKEPEEERGREQSRKSGSGQDPAKEEPGSEQDPSEEGQEIYSRYALSVEIAKDVLYAGEKAQLIVDTDGPIEDLKYESADESVAVVSKDGWVTAKNGGKKGKKTVEIKVSCVNPDYPQDLVSATCLVTVENTISLNKKSWTIYTGQKNVYQLKAKVAPKGGTVTWKSSKPSIASIDENGKITPKKAGKVTITAKAGGVSATCEVTVKKPSLTLNGSKTVYLNHPVSLGAKASPSAQIKWSSSDRKVARVNSKGVVTGYKTGTAIITAKAHGITKACKVTVKKPSLKISDDLYAQNPEKQTFVFQGSSLQLYATSKPEEAVQWKSSNKKIATVDETGKVTAVKEGTATITASISGAKDTWKVTVVKNPCKLNFTSKTMMVGQKATLYVKNAYQVGAPYFSLMENAESISLATDGNNCEITANAKGKSVIDVSFISYVDGKPIRWHQLCTVKVVDTGISAQQFSLAVKKTKQLKIKNVKDVQGIAWKSSDAKVASVDPKTGKVTGKKAGSATITATVTFKSGQKKSYTAKMKVSDPKMSSTVVLALYSSKSVKLKGTNSYSSIQWKSKKPSVVAVTAEGVLVPQKRGTATLTAKVDGKTLSCSVYVSDPKLKTSYCALSPGKKKTISVKGLTKKSKVSYKSSNKGVATVNKSGVITAKGGGQADILVTVDGREFHYKVEVASQSALDACKVAHGIMFSSSYSQALRMTEGYYDCSSLVFRAYGKNTRLLGGISSWAPTAAAMAMHMKNTGKVLNMGPVSADQLRPGDLIFYGYSNNGRYLGIYHVSMYYGNGCRLERSMTPYYPNSNIVMVARPVP